MMTGGCARVLWRDPAANPPSHTRNTGPASLRPPRPLRRPRLRILRLPPDPPPPRAVTGVALRPDRRAYRQDARVRVRPENDVPPPLRRDLPHLPLHGLPRPDGPHARARRRRVRARLPPAAGPRRGHLPPRQGHLRSSRADRRRDGRRSQSLRAPEEARPDTRRLADPLSDRSPDLGRSRVRGGPRGAASPGGERLGARRPPALRALRGPRGRDAASGLRDLLVDPPRRHPLLRELSPVLQALPHPDRDTEHLLHEARSDGAARHPGPRELRALRRLAGRAPLLEVRPGRLYLHRVRALPRGMPHRAHGQAARPQGVHRADAGRRL